MFQVPRKDYSILATICHEKLSFLLANTVLHFSDELNGFKAHGLNPRSKCHCLLLFNSWGNLLLSKSSSFSLTRVLNYLPRLTGHYGTAKTQTPCAVRSRAMPNHQLLVHKQRTSLLLSLSYLLLSSHTYHRFYQLKCVHGDSSINRWRFIQDWSPQQIQTHCSLRASLTEARFMLGIIPLALLKPQDELQYSWIKKHITKKCWRTLSVLNTGSPTHGSKVAWWGNSVSLVRFCKNRPFTRGIVFSSSNKHGNYLSCHF